MKKVFILLYIFICTNVCIQGQEKDRATLSDLPPLLPYSESTLDAWNDRRTKILKLLQEYEYGAIPRHHGISVEYRQRGIDTMALSGLAKRKEVDIVFSKGNNKCILHLLMYLPKKVIRPAVFLGVNAMGNYTVHKDEGISMYYDSQKGLSIQRGCDSLSWNIVETLRRQYAFVTFCSKDICDDTVTGIENKLGEMLYGAQRDSTSCGFIGIVAWGMSQAMHYLETDSDIDPQRVIAIGHSRYGKIALWAAAQDERFVGVIANSSGSGGASLYRGNRVETPYDIYKRFPHWMCKRFYKYADRVEKVGFPIDQHMVLSLLAPRPMYIANSDEDAYVCPNLEYAALLEVVPIYNLYGYLLNYWKELPATGSVICQRVGYHLKPGAHSMTPFDWRCFYEFADRYIMDNN
ncbi:alpha/beta hydrolase family protein [Bacteroides clarus]